MIKLGLAFIALMAYFLAMGSDRIEWVPLILWSVVLICIAVILLVYFFVFHITDHFEGKDDCCSTDNPERDDAYRRDPPKNRH